MQGSCSPHRPVDSCAPTEQQDQFPARRRRYHLVPVAVAVWDLLQAIALAATHAPHRYLPIDVINNPYELTCPSTCPCRTLAVKSVQVDDTRGQRIRLEGPCRIRSLAFSTLYWQSPAPRLGGPELPHYIKGVSLNSRAGRAVIRSDMYVRRATEDSVTFFHGSAAPCSERRPAEERPKSSRSRS
jgi:hypothetical protein